MISFGHLSRFYGHENIIFIILNDFFPSLVETRLDLLQSHLRHHMIYHVTSQVHIVVIFLPCLLFFYGKHCSNYFIYIILYLRWVWNWLPETELSSYMYDSVVLCFRNSRSPYLRNRTYVYKLFFVLGWSFCKYLITTNLLHSHIRPISVFKKIRKSKVIVHLPTKKGKEECLLFEILPHTKGKPSL